MVIFFRKYLTPAKFKFPSQQLQSTLTTAFERHFAIEDFTDINNISVKPEAEPGRVTATKCYIFIFRETLVPVNSKNY